MPACTRLHVVRLLVLLVVLFLRVGLTVDRFVTIMSTKMSARDDDEHIRQMFLAFDMQCTCPP